MTKTEAIAAMKSGLRVAHRYFSPDEWMESNQDGTMFTLEDGVRCDPCEFWHNRKGASWEDGWHIVPNKTES